MRNNPVVKNEENMGRKTMQMTYRKKKSNVGVGVPDGSGVPREHCGRRPGEEQGQASVTQQDVGVFSQFIWCIHYLFVLVLFKCLLS